MTFKFRSPKRVRIITRLRNEFPSYRWVYHAQFHEWQAFHPMQQDQKPLLVVRGYSSEYDESRGTHLVTYEGVTHSGQRMPILCIPPKLEKVE